MKTTMDLLVDKLTETMTLALAVVVLLAALALIKGSLRGIK